MTNPVFNLFNSPTEQNLIESLIIESISIYGHEIYYCPRTIVKKDELYGEDSLSTYNSAHEMDLYIKSYDSYEGDGTFLSKFNLEIRDQIKFSVARKTFNTYFDLTNPTITRPREGDLIYSPMMKRIFIIKYVNNTSIFYQLGALQTWDLTCEVFEYSNERLNTGIADIDDIETDYSFAGANTTVMSSNNYESALMDVFSTNQELDTFANNLIDWSTTDPFSGGNI